MRFDALIVLSLDAVNGFEDEIDRCSNPFLWPNKPSSEGRDCTGDVGEVSPALELMTDDPWDNLFAFLSLRVFR